MDRGIPNQCERRLYHHCTTAPAPCAPTVPIHPYQSTSRTCEEAAAQSLDTVRSLHQTVVSLRTALDDARREINNLKKQMTVQTVIDEGKTFKANDPDLQKSGEEPPKEQTIKPDNLAAKMGSKIDLKIRVSSNMNVSEGGSGGSGGNGEDGKGPDSSRSIVSIKLTSRENLNVTQQDENVYSYNQSTNEEVQLKANEAEDTPIEGSSAEQPEPEDGDVQHRDPDDDDDKSISDGDNSVFDESKGEPQKDALGIPRPKIIRAHSDNGEEVDDIELIFSSEDHKELIQEEEMVSISATYEPWQKSGSSGTPELVRFGKLSMDDDRHQSMGKSQHSKQASLDSTESQSSRQLQAKCSLDDTTTTAGSNVQRGSSLGNTKWNNRKELDVTDISKCGISEENLMDMSRRNTCPNPPVYRPLLMQGPRDLLPPRSRYSMANKCALGTKFSRSAVRSGFLNSPNRVSLRSPLIAITNYGNVRENSSSPPTMSDKEGPMRSSSVQTDISAVPDHWQSESHLAGGCCGNGLFTLPSKFSPAIRTGGHCGRAPLRPSEKTQEARRVLLSDINFTSMIPELSRSADHLCPDEEGTGPEHESQAGHHNESHHQAHFGCQHGHLLQTPNAYGKGLTPSTSINSHGSINENSFATQTTQTGDYWLQKGDSFDSTSYNTNDSRLSLNRNCRSRSVPSIKCVYCKRSHGFNQMRTSESMHYTPRVLSIPESYAVVKGSLPDLRHECCCPRRYQGHSLARLHSSGSTESLIDDAEEFIRRSITNVANADYATRIAKPNRRCSENDIGRSYTPSKQSLPFLPKTANCLKIGHLAKVIARNGRVVVGQVRYIGPICNAEYVAKLDGVTHDTFIGLELPSNGGDTDGAIEGKRFFHCDQNHGIFVPFPKVIMAWTS